jgi:hypothetical protein
MPLSKDVLIKYPNEVFVETGALDGDGINLALELGFKKVYSIEILSWRVEILLNKFKDYPVTIICGDSSIILPELIKTISKATIWLDAHVDITELNLVSTGKPLAQELACLLGTPHTILIDDLRIFSKWGLTVDKIIKMFPEKKVSFEDGCCEKDIMVLK